MNIIIKDYLCVLRTEDNIISNEPSFALQLWSFTKNKQINTHISIYSFPSFELFFPHLIIVKYEIIRHS